METIQIDGSYLEGGGQIIRTAVALSAVTGKPCRIFNIRHNRPKPGLMTQHLEGIRAVADLCNAKLEGAELGSREVEFSPGKIEKNNLDISIATAGSVGLIFQILSLAACRSRAKIEININGGGTWVKWAPPLLFSKNILLPVLEKMSYKADIKIIREGFFPAGGAKAEITIFPCSDLKPLNLGNLKMITHIGGLSVANNSLKSNRVAERQAKEAENTLKSKGFQGLVKEMYVESYCPGSGILLWASDGSCIISSDSIGERGKPSEDVGKETAQYLLQTISSGASVDNHISDQILPFMALAKDESNITVPVMTNHAKTNIWVIEKFLPVKFRIDEKTKPITISCKAKGG